jgi:hypothetical protein
MLRMLAFRMVERPAIPRARIRREDPGSEPEVSSAGQGEVSMYDQSDEIAAALDRLHAGGWSVGDTAFYVAGGGLVHVVIGSNGENQIRAEGATCREAWRRALDQAAEVGMLPGRPRPARE